MITQGRRGLVYSKKTVCHQIKNCYHLIGHEHTWKDQLVPEDSLPPKSMTGFGAAESSDNMSSYKTEIKSLNSRYLEVNVRLPKSLLSIETEIIALTKTKLKRGKVDVFINVSSLNQASSLPILDQAVLKHYDDIFKSLNTNLSTKFTAVSPTEFIKLDGVLSDADSKHDHADDENRKKHLLSCVDKALDSLLERRGAEGTALTAAMTKLLDDTATDWKKLDAQSQTLLEELTTQYKTRLTNFISKMQDTKGSESVLAELSEDRLSAEITILANKADITEEITRLGAHIDSFRKALSSDQDIGRKLDFLCQEMHREVNTVSNKMTHLSVSNLTLGMKQNIERLRQQVQNIE